MSNPEIKLGLVGATGLVGETVLDILDERQFEGQINIRELSPFASESSEGDSIDWSGLDIDLRYARSAQDFEGLDYVIVSAGGDKTKTKVSKEVIPMITEAGAIAIDNSSAFRSDPDVPLVVSEANPEALDNIPKGIVANPNCTTMQAMPPLKALHDKYGLRKVIMSSYQSVSGQGKAGIEETAEQSREMLETVDWLVSGDIRDKGLPGSNIFPATPAFNVVPQAGSFEYGEFDTTEEKKFKNESRKILGLGNLAIDATCVRVPVFNVHSLNINASFEKPVDLLGAVDKLYKMPGISLRTVPETLNAAGIDDVLVGRVRESEALENGIQFFVAGDNLRKGAALNAVQIVELLASKKELSRQSS